MIKAVVFDMFETLITHYNCPVYFGTQIAEDMGIPESGLRQLWDDSERDRALGTVTLEQILETIMRRNGVYSEELLKKIADKRRAVKAECFRRLNPDIIPMLEALKAAGYKLGLISNCYDEERDAIKASVLYKYFDVPCLSCDLGIIKPDVRIFEMCIKKLGVKPEECLFVGDGGSNELIGAKNAGMNRLQATWYFNSFYSGPAGVEDVPKGLKPMDVIKAAAEYI